MLTEFLLNGFQQASSVQGVASRRSTSTTKSDSSSSSQPTVAGAATNAATVSISPYSLQKSRAASSNNTTKDASGKPLTESQQKEVKELKKLDTDVHAHEQAHLAAAGPYAKGGAHYDYQTGPDGLQYAVGGEVNIDTSKEKDPKQALQKANAIRAAALAPSDPSGQDQSVAASATQMASEAQQEISSQSTSKFGATNDTAAQDATTQAKSTEQKQNQAVSQESERFNTASNVQQNGSALSAIKIPNGYSSAARTNSTSSYSWIA